MPENENKALTNDEATAAEEKAADQAQKDADARLYTGDSMSYTEYDAVGKGPDYEPSPEVKAQNAAKDKAVAESAADVNNMTPEEREAKKAEAKSRGQERADEVRTQKATTKPG